MLRPDAAAVRGPGGVCLVADDHRGLTPGESERIRELVREDRTVHVLLVGDGSGAKDARAAGATVSALAGHPLPPAFRVPNLYELSHPDRCDRIRHAIAALHAERRFGVIEFPLRGGLGFRAIQAKRAGLGFEDVTLAVRPDECSQRERERACRWPSGMGELEIDFAERFSFENADEVVEADAGLVSYLERQGWRAGVRQDVGEPATPLVTVAVAHFNLGRYLAATLESLAAQTYPNLEVLVVDDGSTDPHSPAVFAELEKRFPAFRFARQPNTGIGATRNRCLREARGEFFLPFDADNLARPDMVERFVAAIRRNPHLSAMTCFFLAFEGDGEPEGHTFALRPAGGPHALAGIRNVYGDASAIFRTADFREVGGYETDRGTSCEDWEAFVKLVHAGRRIGVVPDHLFEYRFRPGGFSRTTNWFANHQRVLRQFADPGRLPTGESAAVWAALVGFHQEIERLTAENQRLRYRLADRVHALCRRVPGARWAGRLLGATT